MAPGENEFDTPELEENNNQKALLSPTCAHSRDGSLASPVALVLSVSGGAPESQAPLARRARPQCGL